MALPKDNPGILYRTEYFDALGNVVAALLMSQIHYWYAPAKNGSSKLRVLRKGKWWIAKSIAEWASECHLSVDQVKYGIKILEAKGLVETEAFMFGKSPVTHLRFLAVQGKGPIFEVPDLTPFLIKGASPIGNPTQGVGAVTQGVGTATQGVGATPQSITETTHETKKTLQQVGNAEDQPEVQSLTPGGDMAFKLSTKGKAMDSSKDILAKISSTPKKGLEDYQVSPKGIYYLWANVVPEVFPEVGCQKAWTRKQEGFVNRLVTLWGAQDTRAIVDYTLRNWVKFMKYCEEKSGAFKTPELPSIDILYRYGAEAKNFWAARAVVKSKDLNIPEPPKKKLVITKAKATVPVQVIATPPQNLTPDDPEDKEMTLEELQQWKAENGF